MAEDTKLKILTFIDNNRLQDHTIPDIQKGIQVKNRELVVVTLKELEMEGKIRSWPKGRVKYYHING